MCPRERYPQRRGVGVGVATLHSADSRGGWFVLLEDRQTNE